jgi:hypothetical protein
VALFIHPFCLKIVRSVGKNKRYFATEARQSGAATYLSVIRKNATALTQYQTLTAASLIRKAATGISNAATGLRFDSY